MPEAEQQDRPEPQAAPEAGTGLGAGATPEAEAAPGAGAAPDVGAAPGSGTDSAFEPPVGWGLFFVVLLLVGGAGSLRQHEFINLRVFFGLLLVLLFPGYALIAAMFPRPGELDEEFDGLYRLTLGMAMSICVIILVGFVLGNPGLGYAPTPDPDIDDDGTYNDEDGDVDGDGLPNEYEKLFTLELTEYENYLQNGPVHKNLTFAFQKNNYSLSSKASISRENNITWNIEDLKSEYVVENNSDLLEISGRDNDDDGDGVADWSDDSPQGEQKGYFQLRYLAPTLSSITLILLWAGWYRGAYPWLGMLHPRLARAPPGIALPAELAVEGKQITPDLIEIHGLHHERRAVKRKLDSLTRRQRTGSRAMQSYYARQRRKLLADLADIDERLAELEGGT